MKFNKKDFDDEYSTCLLAEVKYLKNEGIPYSFVKKSENGVNFYKYTKTKDLFLKLSKFYK